MPGVNKVILLGNLGADPDLRKTPGGDSVCEIRVATNESWTDKNGQHQERTEWHRVVIWGRRAEVCARYLSKGRQVYVEGRSQTRSYDDKDGVRRYAHEVVASNVQFIGGAPDREDGEPRGGSSPEGGASRRDDDRGHEGRDDFGRGRGSYGRHPVGPEDDLPF